jgi:phosphatidylserine decarboxylase
LKIVSDGIYYACACLLLGIIGSYLVNVWIGVPFYILAAFCLYFFRDPERVIPPGDVVVSPADGKVVAIKTLTETETRISIFLNVFDVHVNRTPVPGRIIEVAYQKGKFLVASHEAASADNEQNTLTLQGPSGRVICKQIAGLIARRIVCYKKAGDTVKAGERIGYIKFGSRMDVILGPEYSVAVKLGQRVAAGSSILALPVSESSSVEGASPVYPR